MITKPKNRYLLVEASDPVDSRDISVSHSIVNAVIGEIGAVGYAKTGIKVVYQLGDSAFIMRVNRGHEESVILALSFVKSMAGRKIGFYTLRTSGTMRKLISTFKRMKP